MDNNNFGKFIVKLRKEKGLTQKELADRLYITDKAVSKWERGLSFPDITILKSLAEILEVDVSELLNQEIGKKESFDLEKEIKKAIKEFEIKKRQKSTKMIAITIILITIITFVTITVYCLYNKYHPKIIENGENTYSIGIYNLDKNGLDEMIEIIQKSSEMTQKYIVSYFEARVDKIGNVEKFTLSLNTFDENNKYIGRVGYTYENNKLSYVEPTNDNLEIAVEYDENSNIEYISECIKKIPLKEQIKKSTLKNYVIRYQPNTIIDEGTPIFDMKLEEKEALTKDEYNSGKGGISNGNTNVVIRLYDGSSMVSEEQYLYVFSPVSLENANNPNHMMDADYYINNGTLKFTRDYGKTWIETDITKEELDETLKFHKNSLSLPTNSWFIAKNQYLPIAYFYLEEPVLKVSFDNGITWNQKEFPKSQEFGNNITRRVVGFTTKNNGYVALGTEWSMGLGENKKMYVTNDMGKSWQERALPLTNTSSTLVDLCMYDENNGVLILDNNIDNNFPLIYATKDGGKTWQEVNLSYFNLPDEIVYLVDIDNIEKQNNEYIITLGQGETGTLKAVFKTNDLTNPWTFNKTKRENIHTVG